MMRAQFQGNAPPAEEIRERLNALGRTFAWKHGRRPLYVYWRDDELMQAAKELTRRPSSMNGLRQTAFPDVRQLNWGVLQRCSIS